MTAHQTKFFKLKEVSFPILLGIVGVSVALVLHVFGVFSHAKPIENEDKVTVDGVENVVQYLTSLVLHAPGTSSQLITIQYDGGIDALRVNGRVNADALVIDAGQVNNNSSVEGNAVFGGMGNRVDGQTSNNLIVGGENNTINFARLNGAIPGRFGVSQGGGSVVIGSAKSEIRTSDNVLNIGTTNSSFSNKTRNVAAIGGQVVAQDVENSVAFGAGKKTLASNSILLGKSINAGGKSQIFVWSDSDEEFAPEHSNAFYVNAANGFGLNTTAPRTKLDLGNVGVLKIAKTEPKNCSQSSAGVTSYAGSVFCGCDGKEWIPLTSDMTPEKVAACKTLGKVKCIGTINTDSNATNMGESSTYSRWNHESDKREPMGWKYSSKDKLGACEYNCKIGFHPGANDPEGWLQVGACKACSEVVNKFRWKTAGTGDDNCDFTCKASFKYANEGKGKQSCSDCELGTYTENDNQDKTCKACDKPAKLWRDKPGSDPYFSGFTTKGDGANACDFDCAPRYQHFFNGKKSDKNNVPIGLNEPVNGNACIFCKVGTWSAGGKSTCKECTKKTADISYIVGGRSYTLNKTAEYTTNGDNDNCEWKCNYGLIKRGDSCECQDTTSTHLENKSCEPNRKSVPCDSTGIPQNADPVIKNVPITWSGNWNNGSWTAPAKCEWTCKSGYKRSGNTCVLKQGGKCADRYRNRLLDDLKSTDSLCDIGEKRNFGFNTATNKWEWSCVGDTETASCFATKRSPQGGKCGARHYQCETSFSNVENKDTPKLDNGWAWICSGKDGGDGAQCLECNDGYERKPNLGQGVYNGACVKKTWYEWKCVTFTNTTGFCSIPMSGDPSSGIQDGPTETPAGGIVKYVTCGYKDEQSCIEDTRCRWYRRNPPILSQRAVCVKFDEPNDRSKDSKYPSRDCRGAKPDCNKLSLTYSCQGSLPANAIANNSNKPTSSNKNYFYSTNASEPCSFQCKEGYNWKDGFCVKNVKYEWKCIYDDGSGLGGKCVLKSSGTTPSDKGCLQQLPPHYVQCNKNGRGDPYAYCTIRLKGACSYSKENCEKCKGELGGGKPYWFEGLSFDSCNGIKTQEECGKRTECKWENDKFGFVPREVPVCVDKSAPNDRSKDSENPNIDCPGIPPSCGISINFDKNCKNTKIYTGWSSSGGFVNHHFEVFANVDSGCSIRNIRYEDTDYCGNFSKVLSISGDIKNSGYQIPLPSHEPSISFENYPQWENDKRSRKYTYDVYSGEERVSPDKELLIKAIPCISGKPGATCLMPYACN